MAINVGKVAYHKNSLANNTPKTSTAKEGGFVHYQEKVEGRVIQARSDSFKDHFSQARLFWNSMTPPEKKHIRNAFIFEVGKVKSKNIRQQVVDMFVHVDKELASIIAENVGVNRPTGKQSEVSETSPALSQINTRYYPYTLRVGVLIGNGFDAAEVRTVVTALLNTGVHVDLIGEKLGVVRSNDNVKGNITQTFLTADPVLYDALYVVGGKAENEAKFQSDITYYINEAFKHYKPIGIATSGNEFFEASNAKEGPGIIFASEDDEFDEDFIKAVALQRFWNRDIYQ
jgi:catalase